MTTNTNTIAGLTRENIKSRTAKLIDKELELTERLIIMFQSGQVGDGPVVPERAQRVHDAAKAWLNGAGPLLAPLPSGQTETEVLIEREGVRLALKTLQEKDFEVEAIEAAQNAVTLAPQFLAMQKAWLLAAAAFDAAENACNDFLASAGGTVSNALPWSHVPLGRGALIDVPGMHWSKWPTTEHVIEGAIEAGLISRSEIDRARKVAR